MRTLEKNGIQKRDEPEPTAVPRARVDRRLSPETVAQLVAEYEAGTSSNQLVRDFNLGKGSVLRLLREAGVAIRGQSLSLTDLDAAAQLYASGSSLRNVGEQFGVSVDAVRNAFVRNGVQMRPRRGWNYET